MRESGAKDGNNMQRKKMTGALSRVVFSKLCVGYINYIRIATLL